MGPAERLDSKLLDQRLAQIAEGFKEAIRREVRRLREHGLPVYVAENGNVTTRPSPPKPETPE